MPRSPRRALPGLVLAVALVAGGCSGDDGGDGPAAPASTQPAAKTSTTAADGAPEAVTRTDAELDLPRSLLYAGVELELTGAVWSNATPATFDRDEPSVGDAELLYLELSTGFVDDFPGEDSLMPVTHFAVETEGGERIAAVAPDLAEVPVKASADTSVVLAFELPADELEGAALTYDDGEHVATSVPLTGEVPESPYPVRTEIGETRAPALATGCDPAPAEVELVAVEWDVDGGVAVDGTKLARGRSSRVDVDHRWVRAELEVTARTGACGGTYANQDTFRVVADDETIEPVNVYSLTLADGATEPMTFLFEVPDDATEVVLDAGAEGAATEAFDLEVPELP